MTNCVFALCHPGTVTAATECLRGGARPSDDRARPTRTRARAVAPLFKAAFMYRYEFIDDIQTLLVVGILLRRRLARLAYRCVYFPSLLSYTYVQCPVTGDCLLLPLSTHLTSMLYTINTIHLYYTHYAPLLPSPSCVPMPCRLRMPFACAARAHLPCAHPAHARAHPARKDFRPGGTRNQVSILTPVIRC